MKKDIPESQENMIDHDTQLRINSNLCFTQYVRVADYKQTTCSS